MKAARLSFTVAFLVGCGAPAPLAPALPDVPIRPMAPAAPRDDGKLHLHRNYFALASVGPVAHHFTVCFLDVEQSQCEVAVDGGRATIVDCMFPGCASHGVPALPAEVANEGALAEAAVKHTHPSASRIALRYGGRYRRLRVSEMIVTTRARLLDHPMGWHAELALRANPELTRIEGGAAGLSMSGYGAIEIPREAARIDYRVEPDGLGLVLGPAVLSGKVGAHGDAALAEALATARRVVEGKPVPTMAALLDAPLDPTLPSTYEPVVTLDVSIYGRRRTGTQTVADLALPIHPRETIVSGRAVATAETDVDGVHVKVTATLGPFAPAAGAPPRAYVDYEGDDREAPLAIRVEDDRGHVLAGTFPARGKVILQGSVMALPSGLTLPGSSRPSKEADRLEASWPGNGVATAIDVYIRPGLMTTR